MTNIWLDLEKKGEEVSPTLEPELEKKAPPKELGASKPQVERKQSASKQVASKQVGEYEIPNEVVDVVRRLSQSKFLAQKTFRYSEEETQRLEALMRKLVDQGIFKPTKNDVVRIALNFLIEDFETKGKNSLLFKVLGASK